MKSAPFPPNEDERLSRLYSYGILDTLDEQEYDDIVRMVTQICRTPMANISLVDRDRQWYKAVVGLNERETSRDVAFCAHTILDDRLMVVEDATADERFFDSPLVTEDPEIRFYAGMPLITPDGYRLGSLCALDVAPRTLDDEQRYALAVLSRHVVDLLELRKRTRELTEESRMKSRLLAIMAHDMRSPILSLSNLLSMLTADELEDKDKAQVMTELADRLTSTNYLIDNIVTWASRVLSEDTGQSSGGPEELRLRREEIDLSELFAELRASLNDDLNAKGNTLEVSVDPEDSVISDRNVIVFILRNLLVNANKFTSRGTISIWTEPTEMGFAFHVGDTGEGMSPERVSSLFDWNARRSELGTAGESGAGLALLLCSDMAHRIGGELSAESAPGEGSVFTVSLPD